MLRARVAQKPTMAVREGTKKAMNSAVVANLLGRASMGPSPPARMVAQARRARPATMRNGAAHASRSLMESLPFTTMYMFQSQNTPKAIQMAPGRPAHAGQAVLSMVWMAWPPIQVWMPNHPQATTARSRAGMLEPTVPKDERARTGNG